MVVCQTTKAGSSRVNIGDPTKRFVMPTGLLQTMLMPSGVPVKSPRSLGSPKRQSCIGSGRMGYLDAPFPKRERSSTGECSVPIIRCGTGVVNSTPTGRVGSRQNGKSSTSHKNGRWLAPPLGSVLKRPANAAGCTAPMPPTCRSTFTTLFHSPIENSEPSRATLPFFVKSATISYTPRGM